MSFNLPDNWSWKAYDQYVGGNEPDEDCCPHGVGFDERCPDCTGNPEGEPEAAS